MSKDENFITSWGAERALVMSKLDDYGQTLNDLVVKLQKLSEAVAILRVKLGFLVVGSSVAISTIITLLVNYVKQL